VGRGWKRVEEGGRGWEEGRVGTEDVNTLECSAVDPARIIV
jgi:hypothetical protein